MLDMLIVHSCVSLPKGIYCKLPSKELSARTPAHRDSELQEIPAVESTHGTLW
jgi:hypothetical protein